MILGLAAQQTLGNLIAGTVLLSARPFRVGERVRLQGGGLAGQIEGIVSSLGLLYTTFATGEDSIMVPNSVVLNVAILPLREPDGVNLRARLRAGMTPRRPAGDPRALAADAAARRAADHARGARRRRGRGPDRGHAARRERRAASSRANCSSVVSRETRTRAEDAQGEERRCRRPPSGRAGAAPTVTARRGRRPAEPAEPTSALTA